MSLTTGRGPLSSRPAGRFSVQVPEDLTYVEPFRRRVRGVVDGRTVVDSERVLLVHRAESPPVYAFPLEEVTGVHCQPEPATPGYAQVVWDDVDEWYEEEQQVFGHPRNPYHRIDCVPACRRLLVSVGDVVLVDTTDVTALYETALEPRLYVRPELVRTDLLVASSTTTYCPYKGTTTYWSAEVGDTVVEDVAFSYDDPLPESRPIAGLLSFEPARASVAQELPSGGSPW